MSSVDSTPPLKATLLCPTPSLLSCTSGGPAPPWAGRPAEPRRPGRSRYASASLAALYPFPSPKLPRWDEDQDLEAPLSPSFLPSAAWVPGPRGPWAARGDATGWEGKAIAGLTTVGVRHLGRSPDCVRGLVLPSRGTEKPSILPRAAPTQA